MKLSRFLILPVCLLITVGLHSQPLDTVDIYYQHEFIPTGEVSGIDTLYNVSLLMDSTDLISFNSIILESESALKTFPINKGILHAMEHVSPQSALVRMEIQKISGKEKIKVYAMQKDGKQVLLKHESSLWAEKHKAKTLPGIHRNLGKAKGAHFDICEDK